MVWEPDIYSLAGWTHIIEYIKDKLQKMSLACFLTCSEDISVTMLHISITLLRDFHFWGGRGGQNGHFIVVVS